MAALLLDVPLSNNNQWIIYVILGMGGIYFLFRTSSRKRSDPLSDSPVRFSLSQQKAVERDMQNLLVELAEMSRQMTAQLDTRATKLEVLLQEADEKLAALRAANDGIITLPRKTRELREPTQAIEQAAVENYRLPFPVPAEEDPRHAPIYRLADEGKSLPQIAAELGRAKGEVELILALRGKRISDGT